MYRFSKAGLLGSGFALLASLWLVAGGAAHSLLLKSEPDAGAVLTQSPQRVTASFSQELDTGFSTLQVIDGTGRQVDSGDGGVDLDDPTHASLVVTLPPALPHGRYTVHWTAVSSEDGDTTEGEFSFAVGQTDTVPAITTNEPTGPRGTGWFVGAIVLGLGVLLIVVLGFFWGLSRASRG